MVIVAYRHRDALVFQRISLHEIPLQGAETPSCLNVATGG